MRILGLWLAIWLSFMPAVTPYAQAQSQETIKRIYSLLEQKKYKAAEKIIESELKKFPLSTKLHAAHGRYLYECEARTPEAVKEYEQAVKIDPKNAEAHWSLGILYFATNKPQEATDQWREAIRLKPSLAHSQNCHCKGLQTLFKRYPAHKPDAKPSV